jgi:hypothetical protein
MKQVVMLVAVPAFARAAAGQNADDYRGSRGADSAAGDGGPVEHAEGRRLEGGDAAADAHRRRAKPDY